MGENAWPEVTKALEEKRHELTLSEADIVERIKDRGLDMRIFDITSLNFLEMSNILLDKLPEEVGKLDSMINLALQRNKIGKIPETIGNLKNLKFLDISFNDLIDFPDSLGNLKVLHTLNLSCNKLERLPNLSSLTCLVIMHIDHNKLHALPDGIYGLQHLMEIRASHNKITEISQDINQIETLKILDVANNQLRELPGQLADCLKLKDLNLKDNPLNDNRLRKMTTQCNTKAIMEYISSHSGEQVKGKKGKKKKQGKATAKDSESDANIRKIHVMRCSKDDQHLTFKDSVKEIRPFIICTIIKNLDLSDLQMYKKFIALQVLCIET